MKKLIEHIPLCAMLFLSSSSLMAQIDNPDKWGEFVNSDDNVLKRDTFLLQTFSNPDKDNWGYSMTNGEGNLIDVEELGIENATSQMALQLFPGDGFVADSYSNSIYQNTFVSLRIAMKNINTDKYFELKATNSSSTEEPKELKRIAPNDNYNCNFYQKIGESGHSNVGYSGNYTDLSIKINGEKKDNNSYYLIDHLCAYGDIQSHSLFTSTGNWNNTENWSHLPALRNRNALIQGKAIVDESIKCNEIHIDGEIEIINGGELTANKITIHKEFPEKGKWYFVSFPFDVYSNCVGSNLQQGDETTISSGNYFYVCRYNSESRAQNGISASNWEVVNIKSDNELLFEKGKGYLVALDEGATYNNMYVSSTEDESLLLISNNIIYISAENAQSGKEENNGWILCGNPLTSALKLSDIKTDGNTDGNIYVYDGKKYQPYSIGSDYSIPAGEAFFMKANGNTEINIESSGNSALKMISSSPISVFNGNEPVTSPVSIESVKTMEMRIEGNKIVLPPCSNSKVIDIYDISGKVIQSETLSGEQTSYYLPQHKGILIIKIEFNNKVEVLKHIRK